MTSPCVRLLLGAALALATASCQRADVPASGRAQEGAVAIRLTSPSFAGGQNIPARHTCDGEDLSPPLEWSGAPTEAKSLALICDDPDAQVGTWAHWVIYGIAPLSSRLPEGVPASPTVMESARQGVNDFKRVGYGGPCPPPGKAHRYFFRLYALDVKPDLAPDASRRDLLRAMEGHILARGELMGLYARK